MSTSTQANAALPAVDNRQVLGAVIASCFGWALDLFDLFILLFVAPVIGSLFFPLLIFLNERFPTAIRATGTGLSWNIGFAIGGMMPTFVSLFSHTPA
jgi:MFS transporter, MHS family, proline/betaine transporter